KLFRGYGQITGTILDDAGQPLAGAEVSATDSKGVSYKANTNGSGKYTLKSNFFLMGNSYPVKVIKSGFLQSETTAPISIAGENTADGKLNIEGTISGTVGDASCGNVTLS